MARKQKQNKAIKIDASRLSEYGVRYAIYRFLLNSNGIIVEIPGSWVDAQRQLFQIAAAVGATEVELLRH